MLCLQSKHPSTQIPVVNQQVVCWDVDPLSNEEMGRVAVPLSSLKEGTMDMWVEVPRTQHTVATSGWPHAVEVPPESKAFALKLRLTWDEFNEEEIGTIVQVGVHPAATPQLYEPTTMMLTGDESGEEQIGTLAQVIT